MLIHHHEPFNIEVVVSKMFLASDMITYMYFLLVFEFKHNFTYKYFISNIINQVNGQFHFKSILNNTPVNSSFECGKLGYIYLILNVHLNTFE